MTCSIDETSGIGADQRSALSVSFTRAPMQQVAAFGAGAHAMGRLIWSHVARGARTGCSSALIGAACIERAHERVVLRARAVDWGWGTRAASAVEDMQARVR